MSETSFFTRLTGSAWVLPVVRIVLAVAASGSVYYFYTDWRDSLIERGVVQQQAAQGLADAEHIAKINKRLDEISLVSVGDATSAAAQQQAVTREVNRLLKEIRNTPIGVAGADGVCRPTPEAIRNWNSLQTIVVQQPNAVASKFPTWDELMATKLR